MTDAGDGLRLGKKLIFFLCLSCLPAGGGSTERRFNQSSVYQESEAAFEPLSTRDKHADRCKSCSNAGGRSSHCELRTRRFTPEPHAMAAAMTATRCARVANPSDGTGAPTPAQPHPISFIQCESQEICHGGAPRAPAPRRSRPSTRPSDRSSHRSIRSQGYHPRLRQARGRGSPRRDAAPRRHDRRPQRPERSPPTPPSRLRAPSTTRPSCSLADLEMMYIDALWNYYNGGDFTLTDDQYDRLKEELNWQGSGFPTLRRYEVQFVQAASLCQGDPKVTDQGTRNWKRKAKSRWQARRRHRAPPLHQGPAAP